MMPIACKNNEVAIPHQCAPFPSIDELSYCFDFLTPFALSAASCVCHTWNMMSQQVLGRMKELVLGKTKWIRYGKIGDEPCISAKGLLNLFSQAVNAEAFLVPAYLDDVAMKNVIIEKGIVESSRIELQMLLNIDQTYWMIIGESTKDPCHSDVKLYAPTVIEAIIILTFSRYFQQRPSTEIVCQEKTRIGPHTVYIACKKIYNKVHIFGNFTRTPRHNKVQIFGRN